MEFRGLGIGLERKLLLALIAFLLAAVTGCYGGSKVVIPEPRKSVDDEEETVASAGRETGGNENRHQGTCRGEAARQAEVATP